MIGVKYIIKNSIHTHTHTHTPTMTSTADKMSVLFDGERDSWVKILTGLGLQQSDGAPLTEEFLREHLKVEAQQQKRGRKAGSKTKKEDTPVGDCCSAAKHQRTGGDYSKARCGKSADRDDGKGNLLCEDCGARWDTVSGNDIGGQICYSVGAAAKKGYGGAEWMGIHDVDCPPVFIGQSNCVMDAGGKWDLRASMDKVSKDGDRRKGAFHAPHSAWDQSVVSVGTSDKTETEMDEDSTDAEAVSTTSTIVEAASTDVEAASTETYDLDGAPYIKMLYDGETYLYRAYGECLPDPTEKNDAVAMLDVDKDTVEWIDDDYQTEHDEYVENL